MLNAMVRKSYNGWQEHVMGSRKGLLIQSETRSNMGSLAEMVVRFLGLCILSSEENPTSQHGSEQRACCHKYPTALEC